MQAAESEQSIGVDSISEENLHFEENNGDDENSSYDEDTGDDSDEMSEYEESISFHNACREFYMNRKDATESFKHSMERDHEKRTEVDKRKKTTSIDDAMERLRREMVRMNGPIEICINHLLLVLQTFALTVKPCLLLIVSALIAIISFIIIDRGKIFLRFNQN